MYIEEFSVRNYLIHKATKLSLSPVTVLVGPNGGGKSALFDAILNFSMVARGNIRQAFGQFPYSFLATRFHGAGKTARIGFEVLMSRAQGDKEQLRYQIDYSQHGGMESTMPSFHISSESVRIYPKGELLFDRGDADASPLKKAVKFLEDDRGIFAAVRKAFLSGDLKDDDSLVMHSAKEISRFNRFRLNPFILAGTSRLPDVSADAGAPPRLGHEGEELAACLFYLQEKKDPALDTIVAKVQSVLPGFNGFEFNSLGSDRIALSMEFSDERKAVTAVRLSHGILLFLGLMVLIYSSNRPPLMLIEEPENGLTPTALKEFYKAVRELAFREDKSQRSQVLISSHSPFIICEAWNGEDREFIHQVKAEGGHANVRKFSDAIKEQGVFLQKDKSGKSTILGLRTAEELMSGYLS
jgi:predicted ATPase